MIRKTFTFFKNFFFIDQKEGHMSHTKFFSVCGYIIMCWAFVHTTLQGQTDVDYMFWLIFGSIVIGNRSLNNFIKQRVSGNGQEAK